MKNYSIILTIILSLFLVACGSSTGNNYKQTDDDKTDDDKTDDDKKSIININLKDAANTPVINFSLDGTLGTPISLVSYGTVDEQGAFTAKTDATKQEEIPFLQIGEGATSKIYHNINVDAKILLEKNAANVLYLNPEKPETSVTDLGEALGKVQAITYTGIANAEWTNSVKAGTGSLDNLRYFKNKNSGAPAPSIFAKVALADKDVREGKVTIVVDSLGKATITPEDIGNSEGAGISSSAVFKWDETELVGQTGTVTAMNVWKPTKAPVIEISTAGEITNHADTINNGYTLDADDTHVIFIGKGDDSQVGGLITQTYSISEAPRDGKPKNLYTATTDTITWKTTDTDETYYPGLYYANFSRITTAVVLEGSLKLAFVSTSAKAAE